MKLRILDFLKKGALLELIGVPFAKSFVLEDGFVRSEIRLNVSQTNILRPARFDGSTSEDIIDEAEGVEDDYVDASLDDFTINEEDF